MMASARSLLPALGLLICLCPAFRAQGDDDLPNFNAPVDNSPLNVDKVNRKLGVTIFKDPSLWDEDSGFVAERLMWPQESKTSSQSSYRFYPTSKKPVTILGARAYSCVLYATKGHPTEVSIVFVNAGDYDWTDKFLAEYQRRKPDDPALAPIPSPASADSSTNAAPSGPTNTAANAPKEIDTLTQLTPDLRDDINKKVQDDFEKASKQDAQTITDALTGLFGDPSHEGFGGGSETRERVMRWDWQGHSFLLSAPKDQYVLLRIVPVAVAENNGDAGYVDPDDLKAQLLGRVKQLDSGDVVVSDIPMVDQGPKGYCVPATWERYLRFLGIPADMYVLAAAAGTTQDGTDLDAMVQNVDSLVTQYHRKIDMVSGDLDMKTITKNIDNGFPIMWSCTIHVPFERAITRRKNERSKVTDWSAWAAKLVDQDKTEIPAEIVGSPSDGRHQRMIIGYNDKTGEIAISDSWSKAFEIRWMTLQEANAINNGTCYVIGL
jgi:hypothetical protein